MNLKLKEAKTIVRYSRSNKVTLLTLMIAGVLFGVQVWLSGEVATTGQQINQYEVRKQELLTEYTRLQELYNSLSALDSIETKAHEMGLVRVNPDSIHYVSTLDSFASLLQR